MGLISRQAVRPETWSALRERANSLNIPAWKLAEDFGFHDLDDKPLSSVSEKHESK